MPPTTPDLPQQQTDPAAPPKPSAEGFGDRNSNNDANGDGGTHRGPLVAAILVLLVAATVTMVGFIWYRWSGVREPTTAVIMHGDASLAGTEITVAGERTVTATLDASNNYHVPILLEPGEYVVTAQFRGTPIVRATVQVKRFLGVEFNLPTIVKDAVARGTLTLEPAATQPAAR
jgi:hypothetical protein